MDNRNDSPLEGLFQDAPKKGMAEQVYERMRDMIDSGKIEAGYVFPNETVMCQQMRIGRSTLREAYKQLELAGYITRTKRGTSVNDREAVLGATPLKNVVEESSAEDFREFRMMLECRIAELAAMHATEDDLTDLASVQAHLEEARDAQDIEAMMGLDKSFHMGIASATHNQLFIMSMFAISAVWNAQVLRNFERMVEEGQQVLDVMIVDHGAILRALQARDGDAAASAMREHITHVSL